MVLLLMGRKNVSLVQIIMTDLLENTPTIFARRVLTYGIILTGCTYSLCMEEFMVNTPGIYDSMGNVSM